MSKQQHPVISERALHLFRALVERYIREGQPVGSRILARDAELDLSPATVRNVMADLEELGLLRSPHTSAGRIPTVKGYRLFVDSLLQVRRLREAEVERIKAQLDPDASTERLLENASSLLSDVTRLAGVVMLPFREQLAFRHVEFLPLTGNRVLIITVINEREVQNHIIHTQRAYEKSELEQAANYLNRHFAGKDLQTVRELLVSEMQDARERMNQLMMNVIETANQLFGEGHREMPDKDYVLAGETNLMSYAEMSDVEKLRQLFEAFNTKRDILHLLDQCLSTREVQIFIGEESGYDVLDECSVVTAPYKVDGEVLGVLGVIGPTRMAYDRVIPIVDVTARLLGSALKAL